MNKETSKFLHFNGKLIFFQSINGELWIAIKPICEALHINYIAQFKRIKLDPILGELLSNQTMVDAKNAFRNMVALPEFYLYGWLFQIQSGSDALQKYKWECYKILYEHFHGAIRQREAILLEKSLDQYKIDKLEEKLEENPDYIELCELRNKQMRKGRQLKEMDKALIEKQLTLFN